jgi:hypothetical protein
VPAALPGASAVLSETAFDMTPVLCSEERKEMNKYRNAISTNRRMIRGSFETFSGLFLFLDRFLMAGVPFEVEWLK